MLVGRYAFAPLLADAHFADAATTEFCHRVTEPLPVAPKRSHRVLDCDSTVTLPEICCIDMK